jgi:hypothetical protein
LSSLLSLYHHNNEHAWFGANNELAWVWVWLTWLSRPSQTLALHFLTLFLLSLSIRIYCWLARTSHRPISQTFWLKVTPCKYNFKSSCIIKPIDLVICYDAFMLNSICSSRTRNSHFPCYWSKCHSNQERFVTENTCARCNNERPPKCIWSIFYVLSLLNKDAGTSS